MNKHKIQFKRWFVELYWPRIVNNNVNLGLFLDTRIIYKWYNQWSTDKCYSFAFLVLGFGFGICYEPTPTETQRGYE